MNYDNETDLIESPLPLAKSSRAPLVYVVQEPMRRLGDAAPTINLTPALEYGQLRYILPGVPLSHEWNTIVREIRHQMRDFAPDDYLLLTGHPVAIGIATSIGVDMTDGTLNVLQWNRSQGKYRAVALEL